MRGSGFGFFAFFGRHRGSIPPDVAESSSGGVCRAPHGGEEMTGSEVTHCYGAAVTRTRPKRLLVLHHLGLESSDALANDAREQSQSG